MSAEGKISWREKMKNMRFAFFVAGRYLFSRKSHNAINIISGISVCGVAVGTMALVCVLSVLNGFEQLVKIRFIVDPDLKITAVQGKSFDVATEQFSTIKNMSEVAVSPKLSKKMRCCVMTISNCP